MPENLTFLLSLYSGPCDLRPPLQLGKYNVKLEVPVLKWRDIDLY